MPRAIAGARLLDLQQASKPHPPLSTQQSVVGPQSACKLDAEVLIIAKAVAISSIFLTNFIVSTPCPVELGFIFMDLYRIKRRFYAICFCFALQKNCLDLGDERFRGVHLTNLDIIGHIGRLEFFRRKVILALFRFVQPSNSSLTNQWT